MTIRPPTVVLLAITALLGLALAGAATPAEAAGRKGGGGGASAGYSGGGGGGGASYGRGHGGGGSHYRHYRSRRSSPEPGTKRRAYSYRGHKSHRYYRPYRFRGAYGYGYGYRRSPWRWNWSWGRSYQPYYGYSRYAYIEPTPTYYYSPQYYGYYPGRTYYERTLERKVERLQTQLASERYARFYWRAWPPYYRPPGPSAEGSCLYGPDESLLYEPQGKTCSSSLASR